MSSSPDAMPNASASLWEQHTVNRVYGGTGEGAGWLPELFRRRRHALHSTMLQEHARPILAGALDRLVARGLRMSELGIDFSRLWNASDPVDDRDALLVHRVFMLTSVPPALWAVPVANWRVDQSAHKRAAQLCRSSDSSSLRRMPGVLESLVANGHAKVQDWHLDIGSLETQATAVLLAHGQATNVSSVPASAEQLPALLPLLHNETVAATVSAYLGGRVRYDGATVLRLGNGLQSAQEYVSADWHHDRCGRRLKLFIFLHDVDDSTRPTLVAAGSHTLSFYSHQVQAESRVAASWVRSMYPVVRMTGSRGGGFLFDTNAIHRGSARGLHPRTAVILEFHAHGKCADLQRVQLRPRLPCPSQRHSLSWPALPLYPFEAEAALSSVPSSGGEGSMVHVRAAVKSTPGVCGLTAPPAWAGDEGDCIHGDRASIKASAAGIRDLQDCMRACDACARCAYVSFSQRDDDCSWYASCPDPSRLMSVATSDFVTARALETSRHRSKSGRLLEQEPPLSCARLALLGSSPTARANAIEAWARGLPATDAIRLCASLNPVRPAGATSSSPAGPFDEWFAARQSARVRYVQKWSSYLPVYHQYLSRFRGIAPRVLELGVQSGGSQQMWLDYFGAGAHAFGVDVDPVVLDFNSEHVTNTIGDVSDAALTDAHRISTLVMQGSHV